MNQPDDQCPGCSARDGERCDLDCTCGACQQMDAEMEPDGNASTAEERAAEARDQMEAIFRDVK